MFTKHCSASKFRVEASEKMLEEASVSCELLSETLLKTLAFYGIHSLGINFRLECKNDNKSN